MSTKLPPVPKFMSCTYKFDPKLRHTNRFILDCRTVYTSKGCYRFPTRARFSDIITWLVKNDFDLSLGEQIYQTYDWKRDLKPLFR